MHFTTEILFVIRETLKDKTAELIVCKIPWLFFFASVCVCLQKTRRQYPRKCVALNLNFCVNSLTATQLADILNLPIISKLRFLLRTGLLPALTEGNHHHERANSSISLVIEASWWTLTFLKEIGVKKLSDDKLMNIHDMGEGVENNVTMKQMQRMQRSASHLQKKGLKP